MTFTGIDTRKTEPVSGPVTILRDDVLTHVFPSQSFEWIVLVSALEHIGLGYYQDPRDSQGDSKVIRSAYDWLAPGGWLYFDVPWGETYSVKPKHRTYNDASVKSRLHQGLPWVEHWREVSPLAQNRQMPILGVWWQKPSVVH